MGSYGPRGDAVIQSTIMVLQSKHNFRLLAFAPLSFATYTKYFLVPHIAVCLIAEDKDIDLEGAWEMMTNSANHGEALHALQDDDEILEGIFQRNATAALRRQKLEQQSQTKDNDYVRIHPWCPLTS